MRKIATLLICFIVFTNAKAQYVNIPDINFRNFLIAKYPTCFNASGQMDTTCAGILNEDTLHCQNLGIANLDGLQYFKSLIELICEDNKLTNLPILPTTLLFVNCRYNLLTDLPNLPNFLEYLNCRNNPLDSLPSLPNSLSYLDCTNNWLSILPTLPNSLRFLSCSGIGLANLPNLPDSLTSLKCALNQIISLPSLPNSLSYLDIHGNQLASLPNLPNSLEYLDCAVNNISCLPQLPTSLMTLYFQNTKIACIPNTIAIGANINPQLPLCNVTNNPNSCVSFPVIQGNVYTDMNANNIWDNGEYGKRKVKINLSNGTSTFTQQNGFYEISADGIGAYTVSIHQPNLYSAIPASYSYSFSDYNAIVTHTFAIQPTIIKDSLSIIATPLNFRARPGFSFPYLISSENVGTITTNPTVHFIWDSSKLILDSISNTSAINLGNDLSWNISNFAPGQMDNVVAYFRVKTTTAIGDSINHIAIISDGIASATDSGRIIVRGSYDPNEKQATPVLTPAQCALGKYIDYTIHFQNTGTDTAFTVVIADTLSSNLIDSSLQIINSSHNCKTTQNGNKIFFEFKNILLPDSNINEKKSQGFISFKVKPKPTLVNGNTVENKASIYFDYNTPIVTNTAITQINTSGVVLPVQMNSYDVRKVNENKVLNFWATATETNALLFNVQRSDDARIFKTFGKVLAKGNSNHYEFTDVLSINSLPSTLYYRLQIIDKDGSITYSSIKQIRLNELANKSINLYPNPAKDIVNIESKDGIKELKLIDMFGKVISLYTRNDDNLKHQTLNLKQFTKGTYIVQVTTVKGEVVDEKLIVE